MLCHDVMKMDVFTCHEDDSIAECARVMKERNVGFVPVVDDEAKLVGMVTDRDLVLRAVAEYKPATTLVGTVMTRGAQACVPFEDLRAAEEKMASARVSRLVVVDGNGRCAGVISLSDIAQAESRARAGQLPLFGDAAGGARSGRSRRALTPTERV